MEMFDDLLTVREWADLHDVKHATAKDWAILGKLPTVVIGKRVFIHRKARPTHNVRVPLSV